ncbi:hypothetical protein O181_078659, partial [Austropuccinia psidii MF-1]|nr:hypothetical protein [Austropuccinia psidii MF-1]
TDDPIWKEQHHSGRKGGRGTRRSSSFSGVIGGFRALSRTTFKGPGEDGEEEEENSVEEEWSDGTEGVPSHVGTSQGTGGATLAQSNQCEPSLLVIMQQRTQIMSNLHAASSSEASRLLAFKTSCMKTPECFDGTQPFKVRSFIHSFQLIFHNFPANFSQYTKKFLYSTSLHIGRGEKWIEPYTSNLTNQDAKYLLNSWNLFSSQLYTLFWDPNEVIKSEAELDSPRIEEGGHVSLYTSDFRSLVSRIGDWGERSLIHHFRKGLPSRALYQLAFNLSRIDCLQYLMDITLKLDTRYHERQNERSNHPEKNPEASKSNSSHSQNSSSSSQNKNKNFKKRVKLHSSLLRKDLKLMNSEKERRIKEGLFTYCGGKHILESWFKRPQNQLDQPSGRFCSQGKA